MRAGGESDERWESVAEYERRDGTSAPPTLVFDDVVEAKNSLKMRKMPALDEAPAEILGSWGMVADSTLYSLFYKRVAGERGHTTRITGWSDWRLQAIPKPQRSGGYSALATLASVLHFVQIVR